MGTVASILSILATCIAIGVALAGIFAWRRIYAHAVADVQARVIDAQKDEIETQNQQLASLSAKVTRLQTTIATIRYVLRQEGIDITIDDDFVTLTRSNAPKATTTRVQLSKLQTAVEHADAPVVDGNA